MRIPTQRAVVHATDIPPGEIEKENPDKIGKHRYVLISAKPSLPADPIHDRLQPKKNPSE